MMQISGDDYERKKDTSCDQIIQYYVIRNVHRDPFIYS